MSFSAGKMFVVAALVVLLIGCGGAGGNGSPAGQTSTPGPEAAQEEPHLGCTLDYQPLKGPRAMARVSDFVIRGRTGKPRPGLVHYKRNGKIAQVETDILPVRSSGVLNLSSVDGRAVPLVFKIEVCAVGGFDREAALASLAGRPIVAYLVYRKRGIDLPPRTKYPGRKHPPDFLFGPASAEGLLLENSTGDGVYGLQLGEEFPGAKLTDFYPDRKNFPPKALGGD